MKFTFKQVILRQILIWSFVALAPASCRDAGGARSSSLSSDGAGDAIQTVALATTVSQVKKAIADMIKLPAANLANMLGYANVGGTAAHFIGDDMSPITPDGVDAPMGWDSVYRSSDPLAKAPNASRRLSFFLTDIGTLPVSITAQTSETSIARMDPLVIETVQLDNTKGGADFSFTYKITSDIGDVYSYSQTSNFSWTAPFSATVNMVLPASGNTNKTAVIVLDQTQGGANMKNDLAFKNKFISIPVASGSTRTVRLSLIRQRITVPFATHIAVTAGLYFSGMLRSNNFNEDHRGSTDDAMVSYVFGGHGRPFYADLASQTQMDTGPWIWSSLFAAWGDAARTAVADLTDASRYLLPVSGQLVYEEGIGIKIEDVPHDDKTLQRVITQADNSTTFKPTDFAHWDWCYPNPLTNIFSLCPTSGAGGYSNSGR